MKIPKYFNKKQIEVNLVSAKDTYIIASRGFGKSEGIDAPFTLRNITQMPRSTGALLSPTYKKLLANTLPAVCHALDRLGYKRDRHYVLGRKPEKKLNFAKPYVEPFTHEYCMTWFNGTIINFISFDRPMSANSMNIDWLMGFEARYLTWEKIIEEVIPAVRGNENYFGNCPWHHSMTFTTDMPNSKSGQWILEKEKLMDRELIDMIKITAMELRQYKKREDQDNSNVKAKISRLTKDLALFRSNAVFFAEYDIFDNLELIGEKRISEFQRDMPPLMFQTSVLNRRLTKIANGFYPALDENIHCYEVRSSSFLESSNYDFSSSRTADCRHDTDTVPELPLCISLDYNAAINSLVCGQKIENDRTRESRIINSMFVKTPKKIRELVQMWCDYYVHFPGRDVIYFFDATAIYETAATSTSFKDDVIDVLEKNGWNFTPVYMGQPPRHDWKHKEFDKALKGDPEYLFPTFNPHNNEYLILAMQRTGVRIGRNGFEKDKRLETTDDTPENPDELKTHITDAWDQLFIGMNYHYPNMASSIPTGMKW
jgi:hypothetical protein